MLTKALVTNIPQEGSNVYQVRIPLFEDTTSTDIIYDALLCYPPGIYGGLNIGDCVYVAFEDTKLNVPVILGKLYTNIQDDYAYAVINNLDVTQIAKLPDNTKFGDKISVDQMYNMMQNLWAQSMTSEGCCNCPIWRGTGDYSTILSDSENNISSGRYSLSIGSYSKARGNYSVAAGYDVEAIGVSSFAEGSGTEASGNYSHAEGFETIAVADLQHTQGKYNVEDSDGLYADIVGWGTSAAARKNISSLTTLGDLHLAKEIYVMSDDDGKNGYLVPYIVESGTSDGWTYEKWNTGKSECWMTITYVPTSYSTWGGSSFNWYEPMMGPYDYPTGLFISKPLETTGLACTVNTTNSIFWLGTRAPGTATTTAQYVVLGATTTATGREFHLDIHAIGRWK